MPNAAPFALRKKREQRPRSWIAEQINNEVRFVVAPEREPLDAQHVFEIAVAIFPDLHGERAPRGEDNGAATT